MSTDILIGVAISLLTSALSSIGVNLQALALQRERDLNLAVETPLLDPFAHDDNDLHQIDSTHGQIPGKGTRIWQWYLGFALYVSCQCFGSLIALNFISPMILAPLGSAGLIFNIVFSYAFLNTVISNLDYLGTLLIMIGCGLISTFGVDSPQTHPSSDDIRKLLGRGSFVAYASIHAGLIILLSIMISVLLGTLGRMARVVKTRISTIRSMSSNIDTSSSRIPQVNDIIDAGPSDPLLFYTNRLFSEPSISGPSISFAEPEMVNSRPEQSVGGLRRTESTMSISSHVKQNRISALVSLLYASIGGLCASHTLLITKLVVTLPLQPSILISSLVLAVVLLSLGQLYSLNKALEFSLPVLVLPLFFTVYTTVSLADSVVFFDPFSGSGAIGGGDIAMLVLGLLSIIGGVWVLRLG